MYFIIVTLISLGEGSKPFLQYVLPTFFIKTVCVCVCVLKQISSLRFILGFCALCICTVCICAVSDFVFKSYCLWFYVCKAAPRMWIFFSCVPKCDPDRISCANYSLEEILCIKLLRYFDSTCLYCIFCFSKVSAY